MDKEPWPALPHLTQKQPRSCPISPHALVLPASPADESSFQPVKKDIKFSATESPIVGKPATNYGINCRSKRLQRVLGAPVQLPAPIAHTHALPGLMSYRKFVVLKQCTVSCPVWSRS